MALTIGTKLGPYEILAPLGAGGMGEVFRGRDSRLGREVAIKILPAELSSNPDRLRRFEQEAHSASSLNHPNIITIYDIGSFDSRSYIAMELVDGKTLREMLQSGPVLARKAVQIAAQIAEGLAKAHEAGIVHRDLKPENIMITKDGYAKILDFGLAKLFQPAAGDQVSALPTSAQTDAGLVLGTVGYMSPEQASGTGVDFRSDQFSFGAILYEMVTGKRAFQKKTAVETMAAIIQDEPDPVSSANVHIPPPLKWIIERCLEKSASDRYAATKDLARDLQSLRDHFSEIASASDTLAGIPAQPIPKRRNLQRFFNAAAIGLILVLGSALAYFVWRPSKPLETTALGYHRLTYRRGPIRTARFTPDGQTILYSGSFSGGEPELFQTRPDRVESRSLGIQNAEIVSISQTGEMLILMPLGKRILSQVPLSGGSPRELAEQIYGAEWAPDGSTMVISRGAGGKWYLEFPPGKILHESTQQIDRIRFSGSGDAIAFVEHTPEGVNGIVKVIDKNGGKIAQSTDVYPVGISWSPQDKEVWFITLSSEAGGGQELYALDRSSAVRMIQRFPGGTELFDITSDGKVLVGFTDHRVILMLNSPGEKEERELSWLDFTWAVDFSRDGKQILMWERGEGSEAPSGTIFLRGIDGSPAIRLAAGSPSGFSPDGKWVLGSAGNKIMLVPTGAGNIRSFEYPEYAEVDSIGFLPDGKHILLSALKKAESILLRQDIEGGKPQLMETKELNAVTSTGAAISPNGKFLLMLNSERAAFSFEMDTQTARPIPQLEPGEIPFQWTRDGSSVLVMNRFVIPAKVFKVNISTGARNLFRELHPPDPTGIMLIASLLFAPDETMFAYSYQRRITTLYLVQNLR